MVYSAATAPIACVVLICKIVFDSGWIEPALLLALMNCACVAGESVVWVAATGWPLVCAHFACPATCRAHYNK